MQTESISSPPAAVAASTRTEIEAARETYTQHLVHAAGKIDTAIRTGQHLARIRRACAHGEWLPALKRVGVGERTARNLMLVADLKSEIVSDLGGLTAAYRFMATLRDVWPDAMGSALYRDWIAAHVAAGQRDPARILDCIQKSLELQAAIGGSGKTVLLDTRTEYPDPAGLPADFLDALEYAFL